MSRAGMLTLLVIALAPAVCPASEEPPEVLVSRQLQEAQGLEVGQTVVLTVGRGGENPRTYRIAGTYEPVPDPLRITQKRMEARAHLPDLLDHVADSLDPADRETVHAVNLKLRPGADPGEARRELARRAPDLTVLEARGRAGPFAALEQFHQAIAVVTLLGATAFLLALIIMRADERREIAGVLRLVGFSRRRELLQVLIEGLAIATIGAVFGVLFAWATQGLVNRFFQWHYDTALVFLRVTPAIALRSIAVAIPLGVLAGLAASWALLRRNVMELLRR